jgi:hypothetical protein
MNFLLRLLLWLCLPFLLGLSVFMGWLIEENVVYGVFCWCISMMSLFFRIAQFREEMLIKCEMALSMLGRPV